MIEPILSGNRRALARLLTGIENGDPAARHLLAALYPHTGRAHILGITGAPGTGKSTLVNALAHAYRSGAVGAPRTVGIVAVDPTSPFTGGAILGDRIRMRDLAGDPGVFIRSMATRGNLGGLAWATADVVRALDAAGFDIILIETVGAGQAEVDIARHAHTTIVVEAPGFGDDIQAIKAGILEVADILVVNKADQPHADSTFRALRMMLELNHPTRRSELHHGRRVDLAAVDRVQENAEASMQWIPPVLKTIASDHQGVDELVQAISGHDEYLRQSGERWRRERAWLEDELRRLLQEALLSRLLDNVSADLFHAAIAAVQARQIDPHSAVESLLAG